MHTDPVRFCGVRLVGVPQQPPDLCQLWGPGMCCLSPMENPDAATFMGCHQLLPPASPRSGLLPGVALFLPPLSQASGDWPGLGCHLAGVSCTTGATLLPLALSQDCSCWGWGQQ